MDLIGWVPGKGPMNAKETLEPIWAQHLSTLQAKIKEHSFNPVITASNKPYQHPNHSFISHINRCICTYYTIGQLYHTVVSVIIYDLMLNSVSLSMIPKYMLNVQTASTDKMRKVIKDNRPKQ